MVTTPKKNNDSIVGTSREDTIDAWVVNDDVRGLAGNNTLSGNGGNDVEGGIDHNKFFKNNVALKTSKKPRLEARWVNENGKLICKWLGYENEEGS